MLKKALLATMLVFCTTGFCSNMHAADAASLTPKQENIVLVSAWTAQGNLPALKQAFNKALNDGVTVNELKEVSIQMYAYSGFPRSLNALNTLLTVIDERKTAGINVKLQELKMLKEKQLPSQIRKEIDIVLEQQFKLN